MMERMKTLEVLRKSALFLYETPEITSKKSIERVRNSGIATAEAFADEIQKEIDRYYFPRPLFEDGEPVKFGDEIFAGGQIERIGGIEYTHGGLTLINPWEKNSDLVIHDGERLQRPPEPDTQEKIDEDVFLNATDYCKKHGIEWDRCGGIEEQPIVKKERHLLERQRKVCEAKL